MTPRRDPDRLINAFLMEGQTELADPVYDAVRDRIEETPQRAAIGPWRTPVMNRYLRIGLAAAAVVAIAVIGYQFLGKSNVGGPGASESAVPSATATASAAEPSPSAASISHVLWDGPPRITLILPNLGWSGGAGGGILEKGPAGGGPPEGAGMITFSGRLHVYGDPCHWESTRPATPATTVDELVAALAAQPSRAAEAPVDVTVGGHAGKAIALHVPDDLAFSADAFTECDQGKFASFGDDAEPGPARFHQGPGQIDELYLLDVNGVLVTIDTFYYAGTPAAVVDELRAIVQSATFALP